MQEDYCKIEATLVFELRSKPVRTTNKKKHRLDSASKKQGTVLRQTYSLKPHHLQYKKFS